MRIFLAAAACQHTVLHEGFLSVCSEDQWRASPTCACATANGKRSCKAVALTCSHWSRQGVHDCCMLLFHKKPKCFLFLGLRHTVTALRCFVLAIVQCLSLAQAGTQTPCPDNPNSAYIRASLPPEVGCISMKLLRMPGLALHCYPVMYSWRFSFLRPGRHAVQRRHLDEGAALLVFLVLQKKNAASWDGCRHRA